MDTRDLLLMYTVMKVNSDLDLFYDYLKQSRLHTRLRGEVVNAKRKNYSIFQQYN